MYIDPTGRTDAYLTDLATAAGGTWHWNSFTKKAEITLNGKHISFNPERFKNKNGKIVIDNNYFDSLFSNDNATISTVVKKGKITATRTVNVGAGNMVVLPGCDNSYNKPTNKVKDGGNSKKTGNSSNQSDSSGSWVDVLVGGLKSIDDSYYFGLIGGTSDKIRGLMGQDAYDWDYLKNTNTSFALGYKVGSYANAVYGVVNLASGLKKITTSGGTIIVNSAGEVTRVVSGTLEGAEKAIKGFVISAISTTNGASTPEGGSNAGYKAGDTTPGGRTYTKHGAEQANDRGFDSKTVDSIIDNNKKTRVKEIDPESGKVQWRYQDKRGNTVITDEWSTKIVTTYSNPKSANGGNYIPK
jgi:hypothetical protein